MAIVDNQQKAEQRKARETMKKIYGVTMCQIREFGRDGIPCDDNDNRKGMFYCDIHIDVYDVDGNLLGGTGIGGHDSSGLLRTSSDAHGEAIDKARAMCKAIRSTGNEAYLIDLERGADYWCGDDYLAHYLHERKEKAERKAKAEELKARAKELLAQAAKVASGEVYVY